MHSRKATFQMTDEHIAPASSGGSFSPDDIERLSGFVAVLMQIDQRLNRKEVTIDGNKQKS